MNVFTGMIMLIFAAVMYLKYRPRSENGLVLCAMSGMMGFMALLAGAGSWKFQLIQLGLQLTVAFCCFVQLRREKIFRRRRAAVRSLRVHRAGEQPQDKVKTCA
jgi:hypothetical protein